MGNILESIPWARRLKLRHLEVFLALHEAGSLTAAAGQLHMTQPALSHWLADMEEAIGRPLFVRSRRFALTEEGEVLLVHAARMLGDVQRTHADLQAVQSGLSGRLHVGTGLPRVLLPKAIARLQQHSPDVFVSVVEAPLPDLLDRLSKREIDVIIGALSAQAMRSGFAVESLIEDSVQVVVRRGHPLLRRKRLRWQDLGTHPWILPPAGSVMRDVLEQAFAAQGLRPPSPAVEANSSIRVQLLMGERDYLSILAASEVLLYRPLGIIERVLLAPAIPFPDIGAIWEQERASALLTRFLDALRAESRVVTEGD
jgi:DNA-binding transcriptional LysR family regulator